MVNELELPTETVPHRQRTVAADEDQTGKKNLDLVQDAHHDGLPNSQARQGSSTVCRHEEQCLKNLGALDGTDAVSGVVEVPRKYHLRNARATAPSPIGNKNPYDEPSDETASIYALFLGGPDPALPARCGPCQAPPFPPLGRFPIPQTFAGSFLFDPLTQRKRRAICRSLQLDYCRPDSYGGTCTIPLCSYPLRIINVCGDGHCFYRCISRALTGVEDNYRILRYMLHQFIVNNTVDFALEADIHERILSRDEVHFSGPDEMRLMARMLRAPISLFWPSLQFPGSSNRLYRWQTFPHDDSDSVAPGIHIYACGVDLHRYEYPNHFALVTHVEVSLDFLSERSVTERR